MGQSCSLVLFRFRFGTTRNSASSEDLRWRRCHWNRRSTSVRLTARLMGKALEAPHFKATHNLGGASNAFASAFQVALLCFPCYLLFLFVACKLTYLAKFVFTISPSFSCVYSCLFCANCLAQSLRKWLVPMRSFRPNGFNDADPRSFMIYAAECMKAACWKSKMFCSAHIKGCDR